MCASTIRTEGLAVRFIPLFLFLAFILTFLSNISHLALFLVTTYLLLSLSFSYYQGRRPVFGDVSENHLYIAFLCFYLWSLLSFFWSVDISLSSRTAMEFFVCLVALLVGNQLSENEFSRVLKMFITIALIMCIFSAYQVFVQNFGRPVGLFYDWNENGSFLVVGLLLLSVLYVFEQKYHTALAGSGVALFVYAIGLTQSRGAMLSLAVALVIFFLIVVRSQSYRRRFTLLLIWGLLGFTLENLTTYGSLVRLMDTIQSGDISSTRFSLWGSALEQYLQKPYFGYGLGVLWGGFITSRFELDLVPPATPHNDYLQLLVELGPFGLLLFLSFVFLLLWRYSLVRYLDFQQKRSRDALAAWLAMIAVFIHIFFNFHFYSVSFLMIIGLFAGYLGRLDADVGSIRIVTKQGTTALFVRILSLVLILFVLGLHLSSLASDRAMSHAQEADGHDQAMRYYRDAIDLAPYRAEPHVRLGERLMQSLTAAKQQPTDNEKYSLVNSAMQQFQAAKSISKYNYSAYYNSAELMGHFPSMFTHAGIVDNYEMSMRLRPNSLKAYIAYSDYLRANAMSREAWRVLESAWGRWYYNVDAELLSRYLADLLMLREEFATTEDVKAVKELEAKFQHAAVEENVAQGIWLQ